MVEYKVPAIEGLLTCYDAILKGEKTLIIVAHRLTTIANCDKVYEIKEGKAILKTK